MLIVMESNVKNMFGDIAERYDAANDVLSLGHHRSWRRRAVRLADLKAGTRALDIACGTGDFAIELHKAVGPTGSVVASDFSPEMLRIAKSKFAGRNLPIGAVEQDAMDLDLNALGGERFDAVVCGFGVRNFPNAARGIEQMAKMLKPGGKVVVLEFGAPGGVVSKAFYKYYAPWALPLIGGLITGNAAAYKYLPDTSSSFPSGQEFLEIMRSAAEFSALSATTLSFGLAYCYIGRIR